MARSVALGLAAVTCAVAAPAAEAARSWTGHYTVRRGDSLTAIATRYHLTVAALATRNGLDWRMPLPIGAVLRVPGRSHPKAGSGVYVVRFGDTLSGIADRFHLGVSELADANGLDPGGVLLAGAHLKLPSAPLAGVSVLDPYQRGSRGYDVSYPNCGMRPPSADFAVIGLNGGSPFTTSRCFSSEWSKARSPRSIYVNTSYNDRLAAYVSQACVSASSRLGGGAAVRRAYSVGCSEADYDVRLLPGPPQAIWLDVEPANEWARRRALNAATIQGLVARFVAELPETRIGLYSSRAFWHAIIGGWDAAGIPEWVASFTRNCTSGFAAGPVWLNQSDGGRIDADTAC